MQSAEERHSRLIDKVNFSKMKTIMLDFSETIINYLADKQIDEIEALDCMIYGLPCTRVLEGKLIDSILVLSENHQTILYLIDKNKKTISKIDLIQISQISFEKGRGEFAKIKNPKILKENNYISLYSQTQSYFLIFGLSSDLDYFLKSLLELSKEGEGDVMDPFTKNVKKVWLNYDNDFSGKMELKEFCRFIKDLNIKFDKYKSIQEFFQMIDTDKSGEIDFQEFINYYKQFTSGIEFQELFEKYSNKKSYLSPQELVNFFTQEQGETINVNEAARIILEFKQNTDLYLSQNLFNKLREAEKQKIDIFPSLASMELNLLKISLDEFKYILYSKDYSGVYDISRMINMQDMTRPMTHYLINSSHNTYLTGHQLIGESSVEMYSFALLKGYRLVELDCYDGDEENGPKITHGYTLVSNIYLKDALQAIKKSAFVTSNYPVILSIENHCNKKYQDIMGEMFKSILVDLFIIDSEDAPYDYPSPLELKRKFIIKCSRPRIYGDPNREPKKIECVQTIEDNYHVDNKVKYLLDKIKIDDQNSESDVKVENAETENILNEIMKKESVYIDIQETEAVDVKKLKKKDGDSLTNSKMAECCGMLGTKLRLDKLKENNYQPWDCITITEDKTNKFGKNPETRKDLIAYTSRSFGKSYPLRMDSSNLDPTKCWLHGMQIAAINAQSLLDDNTLINYLFFKQNKGVGYVLKPEKLVNPQLMNYEFKVQGNLTLKLLAGVNLHLLLSAENFTRDSSDTISMQTYIIGSYMDDQENKKYETKITHNFLNPLFTNEIYTFDIYETNFTFIFIKLFFKDKLVGRAVIPLNFMSKGVRAVPIYDKLCREYRESVLIFHISKNF